MTILSAIIFLAFACKDKTTASLRKRKANKIILGTKKADSVQWKLVKSYDPYNKGYTYIKDTNDFKYLTLSGDGSFKEYDKENKSKGTWYLNKEKKKLAFVYSKRNGIDIGKSLQEIYFRHHIDTMYQDTMVLSIQGRHGMVKYFYTSPTPLDFNIATDSLSADSLTMTPPSPDSLNQDSLDHSSKN